jgi:hypothetical protein
MPDLQRRRSEALERLESLTAARKVAADHG